jgi:hypothetical protein
MIAQTLCMMVRRPGPAGVVVHTRPADPVGPSQPESQGTSASWTSAASTPTPLSVVLGCTMAGTPQDKLAIVGHLPQGVGAFLGPPPVQLGPYPSGVCA